MQPPADWLKLQGMSDAAEVRMCPKCGVAEVVLVHEWKHTSNFGGATGEATLDFRCQQCGRWYIKKPKSKIWAYWIIGVIFLPLCGFGAPFIYLAWRLQNFDRRVQVVQGAPLPPLRFPSGPPQRSCGKCEGVAAATRTTRHSHNGVPTGTDYVYTCQKCGLVFEVEDALAHSVGFVSGAAALGAGAAFFFLAESAGAKWGGGIVLALISGLAFLRGGERLWNRFKHPPIAWKPPPLSR